MAPSARIRRRLIAAVCAAATIGGLLAACSSGRPDARDTVERLATGLTQQRLAKLPTVAGGRAPQADLDRIVAGMDGLKPKVTVADVSEKDDTATATLKAVWTFDGASWDYQTPVELSYVGNAWQVVWNAAIVAPDLTADERLRVRTSAVDRGDILGAGDAALVTERTVERIGIDKSRITPDQATGSARALADKVGIDADAYAKRVEAAGAQAFVVGITVRSGSDETLGDAELAAIPGAVQLAAELPLAPTRTFGQPMLGVVGEATAEIVAKSKGAIRAGDTVGLSGLSLRYDQQLRGAPGVTVEAVSSQKGAQPASCFPTRGPPGSLCARRSTPICRARRTTSSPVSSRRARSWRSAPRPARSWHSPAAPAARAPTPRQGAVRRPARPSSSSRRWPSCARASSPAARCPAPAP